MDVKVLLALVAGAFAALAGVAWTVVDSTPALPMAAADAGGDASGSQGLHPRGEAGGLAPETMPTLAVAPVEPLPPTPEPAPAPPAEPDEGDAQPSQSVTAPPPPPEPPQDMTAEQELARERACRTEGWHCRTYTWTFEGGDFWLVMELDPQLYQAYRDESKPVRLRESGDSYVAEPAYDIYVSDPRDDAFVGRVANELRRIARSAGLAPADEPAFALAFVQGLAYTSDNVTTGFDEYPRYPLETLVDNGGDCEDTSILYASLLAALGHEPVLISSPDHMAAGLRGFPDSGLSLHIGGEPVLFVETTGKGWEVGEVPPIVEGQELRVWPLDPTPLYKLEDVGVSSQGGLLRVEATLVNLGSVDGSPTLVVEVERSDGQVYATGTCRPGPVEARGRVSCDVEVDLEPVPRGQRVRVEIKAQHGSAVHEALRSTSFTPWPA